MLNLIYLPSTKIKSFSIYATFFQVTKQNKILIFSQFYATSVIFINSMTKMKLVFSFILWLSLIGIQGMPKPQQGKPWFWNIFEKYTFLCANYKSLPDHLLLQTNLNKSKKFWNFWWQDNTFALTMFFWLRKIRLPIHQWF